MSIALRALGTASQRRRAVRTEIDVREFGGRLYFRGYAAVFNQVAYGEVIRPGAFDKTLAESPDVRLLVNHGGVPLARTHAGTLKLSVDGHGLIADAPDLDPENPTVAEIASAMRRGDVNQMSFAFWATIERMSEGVREILEVKLHNGDVSIVTVPWYEGTTAELTELDRALADLNGGRELTPAQRALISNHVSGGGAALSPASSPTPGTGMTRAEALAFIKQCENDAAHKAKRLADWQHRRQR